VVALGPRSGQAVDAGVDGFQATTAEAPVDGAARQARLPQPVEADQPVALSGSAQDRLRDLHRSIIRAACHIEGVSCESGVSSGPVGVVASRKLGRLTAA
jgi:hypothetical protein